MRKFKGVSVWVIATLLVCLVLGGVAAYIFATVKVSVNVEEPLSVVASPSSLGLFPNMTQNFNITVNNNATVNYLVFLVFSLNDTAYQQSYVTFSNDTYTVLPSLNNLTASMSVAPDAPPAQLELTVALSRVSATQPTYDYTFSWGPNAQPIVNGTLTMKLNFTLTNDSLLILAQVNDTTLHFSDMGIIFDKEFDGFHVGDQGYLLTTDNRSKNPPDTALWQQWFLANEIIRRPSPSSYHYCTFDNETGYTFHIELPKSVVPEKTQSFQVQRVHVDYVLVDAAFVEVEFTWEN